MWLFDFLKKVVKGLFSKDNVKDALNVEVNISNKMANAIKLWSKMYEGKADWVKKYWSTWAADKDNAGAKINDKNIFDVINEIQKIY